MPFSTWYNLQLGESILTELVTMQTTHRINKSIDPQEIFSSHHFLRPSPHPSTCFMRDKYLSHTLTRKFACTLSTSLIHVTSSSFFVVTASRSYPFQSNISLKFSLPPTPNSNFNNSLHNINMKKIQIEAYGSKS